MKKMYKILLGALAGVVFAATAYAVPFTPSGPLFIKFTGLEQVSTSGGITDSLFTFTDATLAESNWGVAVITNIFEGYVAEPDATIGPTFNEIYGIGDYGGGQITAMFYGVTPSTNQLGGATFNSQGGYIDLYWNPTTVVNSLDDLAYTDRTSASTFTDITDGELLAHLAFAPGIVPGDGITTISGAGFAFGGTSANVADSYVNQLSGGSWDGVFDKDWFTMYPAISGGGPIYVCSDYPTNDPANCVNVSRDMRFKNSFNTAEPDWSVTGTDVVGYQLDDPAQAAAVPEPASMLLLGTGLAGLAGISRRRRKK